jgi:ERCC4-related helicase
MQLRSYQLRVVKEIDIPHKWKNAIVKMPTGSGKTFVAAECIRRCLQNPENCSRRALFLVPTCDLVAQQAEALRQWCAGMQVGEHMGSTSAPTPEKTIVVSTPEAFRRLQMHKQSDFGWEKFAICVFDEVHHVLKDHPYRHLAHSLRQHAETEGNRVIGDGIRVLGLSASLTYAIGEKAVQCALRNITQDLRLDCILRVSDEELRDGGYDLPHEDIEIAHPQALPEGLVPEQDRRPHLMHQMFFGRIQSGQATEFAQGVRDVVEGMESVALKIVPGFERQCKSVSLKKWEDYAHNMANKHPTYAAFLQKLESWYVALRVLVQTWEQEAQLVLQWLTKCDGFALDRRHQRAVFDSATLAALDKLTAMSRNGSNLSKMACLKAQLIEKQRIFGGKFRGIVFVQQRITAYIVADFISNDPDLRDCSFRADYVTARGQPITPSIKVTSAAATDCMHKFRSGEVNVMVATSVAEEGLDVPAANVVISFDPLKDTVELAQRFGRARQAQRCIVVMDQRHDRPILRLVEARCEQDKMIADFTPADTARDLAAEQQAQYNRERGAHAHLQGPVNPKNALAKLNLYVKKTKAHHTQDFRKDGGDWVYISKYDSVLRSVIAEGRALSKATARQNCAMKLLLQLSEQTAAQ